VTTDLLRLVVRNLRGEIEVKKLADQVEELAVKRNCVELRRDTVLTAIRRCTANRPGSHYEKRKKRYVAHMDLLWEIRRNVLVRLVPSTHVRRRKANSTPDRNQLTLEDIDARSGFGTVKATGGNDTAPPAVRSDLQAAVGNVPVAPSTSGVPIAARPQPEEREEAAATSSLDRSDG